MPLRGQSFRPELAAMTATTSFRRPCAGAVGGWGRQPARQMASHSKATSATRRAVGTALKDAINTRNLIFLNQLASNAATEAVRAAERGLGFAVVAGGFRHLTQCSTGAAKEISSLIDTSAHQVETVDVQARTAAEKIAKGMQRPRAVHAVAAEISMMRRVKPVAIGPPLSCGLVLG
jgi:hypothetical protein